MGVGSVAGSITGSGALGASTGLPQLVQNFDSGSNLLPHFVQNIFYPFLIVKCWSIKCEI